MNNSIPPKVIIVLDPNFGARLEPLINIAPVWIVESETNKTIYRRLRENKAEKDHRNIGSITGFKINCKASRLDKLIDLIPVIELHHALDVGDVIQVVGISLGKDVIDEFKGSGFVPSFCSNESIFARKETSLA